MHAIDHIAAFGLTMNPLPGPLGFFAPFGMLMDLVCLCFVAGLVGLVVFLLVLKPNSNVRPNPNLYACPDCGRPVSRSAVTCPGCGRPLGPMANQ